jgi:hypothetical protein
MRIDEARYLAGLTENHPTSKNMTDADFRKIEDKLRTHLVDLKAAHEGWQHFRASKAGATSVPMAELDEWVKELARIGESIATTAEDLTAGPADAWNY